MTRRIITILLSLIGLLGICLPAQAGPGCYLRTLATKDGSPSGMDDCQLAERLELADLRTHLEPCVGQMRRSAARVYGDMMFQLDLHPGGGLSNLRISPSTFARTSLPACLRRVLLRRLAGLKHGQPASLMGRFTLSPGREDSFGFSLSGQLVPKKKMLPALPGRFVKTEDGLVSQCALDQGQIFLRLDPHRASTAHDWTAAGEPCPQVAACLALADEDSQEAVVTKTKAKKKKGKNGRRKRSARAIKRQVTACLVDLLEQPLWSVRAEAAEALAEGWRWRGRRAIKRAVVHGLRGKTCLEQARERAKREQASKKNGGRISYLDRCPIRLPRDAETGHALVRMIKAHLRLRRSPGEGVLEALARHPVALVRRRLVETIMAKWFRGLPEGLHILLNDGQAGVRARAQQIGCERGDYASLNSFRRDLKHSDSQVRAQALLLARACALRSVDQIAQAAQREPNNALALLMLKAAPTPAGTVLLERAGSGLFDPCPLVRYLAGKLLFRLPQVPHEVIEAALARERDPMLRQQLHQLDSREPHRPIHHTEQVWLQAGKR